MSSEKTSRRLAPVRRERLYESLAEHISTFIEAQGLGPGDRLPSERQLAADLGVSRATLARALASLETRGVIEVRHGVGALVTTGVADEASGGDALPPIALGGRPGHDVRVAREAILAGLARAAAANPRPALKAAMLASDGRPRMFEDTWRCVRRLADSSLLADLDEGLAAAAPAPPDSAALRGRLEVLAEAILQSDPSAAALACNGMLDRSQHPNQDLTTPRRSAP